MGSDELPDTRFLFPDMFSFSFNPEILTFLWGLCSRKTDDIQEIDYRYLLPKSSILQLFVPIEGHQTGFLTFLRYSMVTSSMIVVVGCTSCASFRILQKFRHGGLSWLKSCGLEFYGRLRAPIDSFLMTRKNSSIVLAVNKDKNMGSVQRPCELALSKILEEDGNRLNGNNVPRNIFNVTPLNGEIASGDEDAADVQPQYFGPCGNGIEIELESTPRRNLDSFLRTPGTPDSNLKAKYEAISNNGRSSVSPIRTTNTESPMS